jgi:hypothetical protein
MKAMAGLLMGLVSLHACVYPDDLASAELEQSEIIEVHGCGPGTIGNGEVCIDPLEGGGDGGGGGFTGGEGGPVDGGGGGADPYPIPAPKDCTQELSYEACYQCCDWNVDKVWGERCRRLPDRSKKQRKARALCWETAERLRGECQAACPRIAVTGDL